MMPDLSIIVVSWNIQALLTDLLAMLPAAAAPLAWEAIVVDNASNDGTVATVRRDFPAINVVANDRNVGFAAANNQGIRLAQARFVLLLNGDTRVPPGSLAALVRWMEAQPEVGACAPRLLTPAGTPQPYAFGGSPTLPYLMRRGLLRLLLDRPLHDWGTRQTQEVGWVSGACLLARREALAEVGGLDEAMFMYFEDVDLCLRLRQAGWRVVYHPAIAITHLGGQSLAQNPAARRAYQESLRTLYRKHYGAGAQAILGASLALYNHLRGKGPDG